MRACDRRAARPSLRAAPWRGPAASVHAQQLDTGTAARVRRRRGTHSPQSSVHLPSESGSNFTFVEEMSLPRTARVRAAARGRAHGELVSERVANLAAEQRGNHTICIASVLIDIYADSHSSVSHH